MSELSSAAQAVITASNCAGSRIVQLHIAAALRAAADQVVPTTVDPRLGTVRSDLMRIANELEAHYPLNQ
jgi:hypothetical protein